MFKKMHNNKRGNSNGVKKIILTMLIIGLLPVTFSLAQDTSATDGLLDIIKNLQEQITALRLQITELKSELTDTKKNLEKVEITLEETSIVFTKNLSRGDQNDDVRKLQEFFKKDPAIYPEGLVTSFFGELTEKAVQRFQKKEGIVNSGSGATTGFGHVGPKTRARLNELSAAPTISSVFTIPPGIDTRKPSISRVRVSNIRDASATVRWTTDEVADSFVNYKKSTPVDGGISLSSERLTTSHRLGLKDLESDKAYYFNVVSADSSGNISTSTGHSFTTLSPAPILSQQAGNTHSIDLENSLEKKQYLFIKDNEQAGLDIIQSITMEAWVKLEDTTQEVAIVSKDSVLDLPHQGYSFYIGPNGLRLHVAIKLKYGDTSYIEKEWDSPYSFTAGEWVHVAASFDTQPKFYVNGKILAKPEPNYYIGHKIIDNFLDFNIGAHDEGKKNFVDGKIDDVRVWNVVRTGSEITDNYKKELSGNEEGLVGYWQFNNELIDGKAIDETENENHLHTVNGPVFSTDIPF